MSALRGGGSQVRIRGILFFCSIVVVVGVLFSLSACAERKAPSEVEGFFVKGGGSSSHFLFEVASTDSERRLGLMYRRNLANDRGMIFVFPETSEHSFWMKNTYISLDMFFLDQAMKVVGVLRDVPPMNEAPRTVGRESRYVVELPAGTAERHGICVGVKLALVGALPVGN